MTDRQIEILAPAGSYVSVLQSLQAQMQYMPVVPDSEPGHTPIILQKKS